MNNSVNSNGQRPFVYDPDHQDTQRAHTRKIEGADTKTKTFTNKLATSIIQSKGSQAKPSIFTFISRGNAHLKRLAEAQMRINETKTAARTHLKGVQEQLKVKLEEKLVELEEQLEDFNQLAQQALTEIQGEVTPRLQASHKKISDAATYIGDGVINNLPGLETPEQREAAKNYIQHLKDPVTELWLNAKADFKDAYAEAVKSVHEARQEWRELNINFEGVAERVHTAVTEHQVFQNFTNPLKEIKKTAAEIAPKTDKQKFDLYSKDMTDTLEKYNNHIENKEWKKAFKTAKKLEKIDKQLTLLLANPSKIFAYSELESAIKTLRSSNQYATLISLQVSRELKPDKIPKTIVEINANITNLSKQELKPETRQVMVQNLETKKAMHWEALLHEVESTAIYTMQPKTIALSEGLEQEFSLAQKELLEIQSQIANLTVPGSKSSPLTAYSERLETVLNRLVGVAKQPTADKRDLQEDLDKVKAAIDALKSELPNEEAAQKEAINKLAEIETTLKSIDLGSSKIISFKKDDPAAFKFTNINNPFAIKSHDPTMVVKEVLNRIEQLAGTPRGNKQALATLSALKTNPVTSPLLAIDPYKAQITTIEQQASSATLDQFQARLFGASDNELQNQFLIAYRGFIEDSFFPNLVEKQPSARLFEWLNVSFNTSTSNYEKLQILEVAKKWAGNPVLNEGDHKISSVKSQIDTLISTASQSQNNELKKAAKEIGDLLKLSPSSAHLPADGNVDLTSLIRNLKAMNDTEYQLALEKVSKDLSAYTAAIFSNLRPSELINGIWEKPEGDKASPHLKELTDYINQLSYYLRSEIMEKDAKDDALKAILFLRDIQYSLLDKSKATPDRPVDAISALAIEIALGGSVANLQTRLNDDPLLKAHKGRVDSPPVLEQKGNYTQLGLFMKEDETPMVPGIPRYMTQIIGAKEVPTTVASETSKDTSLNLSKWTVIANIHKEIFDHKARVNVQTTPLNTNLSTTLSTFKTNVLDVKSTNDIEVAHYDLLNKLVPKPTTTL